MGSGMVNILQEAIILLSTHCNISPLFVSVFEFLPSKNMPIKIVYEPW